MIMMNKSISKEPIAIIGIGCRFPGDVNNPHDFWELLKNGRNVITEAPADRWNNDAFYDEEKESPGKMYTRYGGFLKSIDQFDPVFFGISPREAASMDPQQRLLLETAWEAFEDGGVEPKKVNGANVGVFVGIASHDYYDIQLDSNARDIINSYTHLGGQLSIAANRLSYFFNFKGPSISIDTACSSALVAAHLACAGIWNNESQMALVGAASVIIKPEGSIGFCKASMLSPDGKCKTFDAKANGYVRSEGAGAILLKPLSKAIEDGNLIYATVLGTAINQDGATSGITVPSGAAQERAIIDACARAGVDPTTRIDYVEAHGTGTPVGDPIEANAIGSVVGKNRPPDEKCFVGSVKSNIGHMEPAAGIAGIIKVALSLKNGLIPASLHFETPNPAIDFDSLNLKVPTCLEQWPAKPDKTERIAGVNAFGFGGSNAHILLSKIVNEKDDRFHKENYSVSGARPISGKDQITVLPLSAKSPEALKDLAISYLKYVEDEAIPNNVLLQDICYSAALHRTHHSHRLTISSSTIDYLKEYLQAFIDGENRNEIAVGKNLSDSDIKQAFVFSGMGQQWHGMGRGLLKTQPVFRKTIEECAQLFQKHIKWSLLNDVFAGDDATIINKTEVVQPAIFSLQIAITALLRHWGVKPDAVVGHSIGDVAVAQISGAISLEEAVLITYHRSRLQSKAIGQGTMLAVNLSIEDFENRFKTTKDLISIAAVNSPSSITLSGNEAILNQISSVLTVAQIFNKLLAVELPYHSVALEPFKNELKESLNAIKPREELIPFYSTVFGDKLSDFKPDGSYWASNMRNTVLFSSAINKMIEDGYTSFVEIGAHPVLSYYIKECLTYANSNGKVIPSLRREKDDNRMLNATICQLYANGHSINWRNILAYEGRFVKLPLYPWQREKCWNETEASKQARIQGKNSFHGLVGQETHPLLGGKLKSQADIWNAEIDQRKSKYLKDHTVQGSVVYPSSAYIEMALKASMETFGDKTVGLEQVRIQKAFVLPSKAGSLVQLALESDGISFKISSRPQKLENDWEQNVEGMLTHLEKEEDVTKVAIDEIKSRCLNHFSKDEIYKQFERVGLQYGPAFRGIEDVWANENEAIGELIWPEELLKEKDVYITHPALLDAAFQVLIVFAFDVKTVHLPVKIESVRVYRPMPANKIWSYVRLAGKNKNNLIADIQIVDNNGDLLASIKGFKCRSLNINNEDDVADDKLLYEYRWLRKNRANSRFIKYQDFLLSPLQIQESMEDCAFQLKKASGRYDYYETMKEQINDLSVSYIVSCLNKLGVELCRGNEIYFTKVVNDLGISSAYHSFFKLTLELLQRHGILKESGDHWVVCSLSVISDPEILWRSLIKQYPGYLAELSLISRCGRNMDSVLKNEIDPLELIFPQGSLTNSDHLYQDSPSFRNYNMIISKAVSCLTAKMPANETLRILEIGAGTGGATSYLLSELPHLQTEYVFTDLSEQFLNHAKQKFRQYKFVEYSILDIENDPSKQGFLSHSFDIVLASNVIHATSDLCKSLDNVKKLLTPKGMLILLEGTDPSFAFHLTLGMLKGWWLFSDFDIRPTQPLLAAEEWKNLLLKQQFDQVIVIPEGNDALNSEQSVIIAGAPEKIVDEKEEAYSNKPPKTRTSYLIFADKKGVWEKTVGALPEQEWTPILVFAGDSFKKIDDNRYQVDLEDHNSYRLLIESVGNDSDNLQGVLHFWSLDSLPINQSTSTTLKNDQLLGSLSLLNIVKEIEKAQWAATPRLFVITEGAFIVSGNKLHSISQTTMYGLARVIANEQAGFRIKSIDISPVPTEIEIKNFAEELCSDDIEDEVALRNEARYVHRLMQVTMNDIVDHSETEIEKKTDPFNLIIDKPGLLDSLKEVSITRQKPKPGEVEILVKASALNFKDVVVAMNMLNEEAFEVGYSGANLGMECAGEITAVNETEKVFKPGDKVIATGRNTLGTHFITDSRFVIHKPEKLSFEEGSTIASVYTTVLYSLSKLAHMEKGSRILIHSAAGGVGLAAVQAAQTIGAQVFATAGSNEKREFLNALGVEHVMDSRTTKFADQIMEITSGEGVDIVLNSLIGEAMIKSFYLLRPYGCFVEIGKRDIYDNSKIGLRPFAGNISYFAVDIDSLMQDRPDFVNTLLRQVIANVNNGAYTPIPFRSFPVSKTVDAFRYMAGGKHMGKIVISMDDRKKGEACEGRDKLIFSADATYLITGGLGGFGLALTQWMINKGAKNLVLIGRSKPPETAKTVIESLNNSGAAITTVQCDISIEHEVKGMFTLITDTMPPLKGIIHAAMVLDDAVIQQQNAESFETALAPKAYGAWNLHLQTLTMELDFFALFSSIAVTVGNPGQANYTAANAFLDALAHYRRSIGRPGLSINWGGISDVGYVSQNDKIIEHLIKIGLQPISSNQALEMMGRLITENVTQAGVTSIDWKTWAGKHVAGNSPRFSYLVEAAQSPSEDSSSGLRLVESIKLMEPVERKPQIELCLKENLANVIGTSLNKIDIELSINKFGLDSLTTVEYSNKLKNALGADVPVMKLMGGPTIEQLAIDILELMNLDSGEEPQAKHILPGGQMQFHKDASLASSISMGNLSCRHNDNPKSILLTGSTGFLGAFLLYELLNQTEADIYCLVRASDKDKAKERIIKNFHSYSLEIDNIESRITPIIGDIALPMLGLTAAEIEELSTKIDSIYHNAAYLNFIYPYYKLRDSNVLGTLGLLKLACQNKIKPFHYVSSIAVFESPFYEKKVVTEKDEPIEYSGMIMGYSQSKWASERLVSAAGNNGLPITIYRSPLISGHTLTGAWNTDDFACRLIKGGALMGVIPDLDAALDLAPVDFVSSSIVRLSREEKNLGATFHLVNPYPYHWKQLWKWVNKNYCQVNEIPFVDWQNYIHNNDAIKNNPMYSLVPFFLDKKGDDQITIAELYEQSRKPTFNCRLTTEALNSVNIVCPPVNDKLLEKYFTCFISNGFMERTTKMSFLNH